MNRILALNIAAALGIALVLQGAEAADKPKPKPKPSTGSANDSYLALGDSIPFGKGKGLVEFPALVGTFGKVVVSERTSPQRAATDLRAAAPFPTR